MRQLPFRPGNEISQSFNDGVCTVYRQRDAAHPGYRPRPELEKKAFLRFEEQRVGLTRFNDFKQRDMDVERVIRVPQGPAAQIPTPQDVVSSDGQVFYKIEMVQTVPGVWPPSLDLTLTRFVQKCEEVKINGKRDESQEKKPPER